MWHDMTLILQGMMEIDQVKSLPSREGEPLGICALKRVLNFPDGMHMLGRPTNFPTESVYIRNCYSNLHEILQEYPKSAPMRIWYFTGTPGTIHTACWLLYYLKIPADIAHCGLSLGVGKSYLAGLLVMRYLLVGKVVLWESSTGSPTALPSCLLLQLQQLQMPERRGELIPVEWYRCGGVTDALAGECVLLARPWFAATAAHRAWSKSQDLQL